MGKACGLTGAMALAWLTGCAGTWDFPDAMRVREPMVPSAPAGARLTGSGARAAQCLEKTQQTGPNGAYLTLQPVPCKEPLPPGPTPLHVRGALDPVVVVVPPDRPVDVELTAPSSANRALTAVSYGSLVAGGSAAIPTLIGVYGHVDEAFTVSGAILATTLFTFSTTHVLAEVVGPGRVRYRDPVTGRRRPDERSVELGTPLNVLLIGLTAAGSAAAVGILATDWPNVDTASERLQVNVMATSLFALSSVPLSFVVSNLLHAKDGDP